MALAGGVSRIPLPKFKRMLAFETKLTIITGRVWQMGLPCIVSGTCGSASPSPQSPTHHNISGSVRKISHCEIYNREFDLAPVLIL